MSNKVSMTSIDEDVKWRPEREQIVRMADKRTAFAHPDVVAELRRLNERNRELEQAKVAHILAELLHISSKGFGLRGFLWRRIQYWHEVARDITEQTSSWRR